MSISFTPSGPSVRSDAALAAVSDTSVYTITPRSSPPTSGAESTTLNAALLRSVPWSEAGQAGRLMRGALAERFSVPCYDVSSQADVQRPEPAKCGLARDALGTQPPAPAPALMGAAAATVDMTTEAHLVRRGTRTGENVLFVTFDVLFDPAYRAVDADAMEGGRAVANYQDLVGLSVAPVNAAPDSVRLLPEAAAPRGTNGTPRYAHAQTMEEGGRIAVGPAGESYLSPCAGGRLLYANRIGSSAGSNDFDLSLLLERPGAASNATGRRNQGGASSGGGVCWLSGLQKVGGLSTPAPYDVSRPGSLARKGSGGTRLRRLPSEATAGIDLSYCAAFAVDPARVSGDVKIDVLAAQRMVSMDVGPDEEARLATTLFVTSCRIVLRGGSGASPTLFITRRRCWGTDLRRESDPLGSTTRPRPIPGNAWHG